MNRIGKVSRIIRGIIVFVLFAGLGSLIVSVTDGNVYAETQSLNARARNSATAAAQDFIVTDTANEVNGEFSFLSVSETECSVKLVNKSTATKAVVPSSAIIGGKEYIVTEVSANGFTSAANLVRVYLPKTIDKIGNTAFANCAKLQRISLANIKTIGNNAFYRCPSLTDLVLPRSIESVGSYILRNNDTQVHVREGLNESALSANWNTGNANQDVDYNSTYREPLELETEYKSIDTYSLVSAASETLSGYVVAAGQPCVEEFYDGENYFIPAEYNGLDITAIKMGAFDGAMFGQFVIEYSDIPLQIGSHVFDFTIGSSVTINRAVEFIDSDTGTAAESIFFCSGVNTVVLPDCITELPEYMFSNCMDLTDIFFITPEFTESRDDMLAIAPTLAESGDGAVHLPNTSAFEKICEGAFDGTVSIAELHIYDTVQSVGGDVLNGWESTQKVVVHNDNGKLPEYDQSTGTGWHPQWSGSAVVEYTRNFYNIYFDASGGTVTINSKEVEKGVAVGELPVPENGYWVFDGWIDDQGLKYDEYTVYERDGDCTLSALWIAPEYYIAYDKNTPIDARSEVEGEMDRSSHFYNSISSLNPNMYYLCGWDFLGWNTEPDGSGTSFTDGQDVYDLCSVHNATVTLYAQWQLHYYTITYIINDDDVYNPNTITSYTVNDDTIVFDAPVKEGYNGWWEPNEIFSGSIGDFTPVACFEILPPIEYSIKYELNGSINSPENPDTITSKQTVTLKNPTNKIGYNFVGWMIRGTDAFVKTLSNVTSDLTLEAIWVEWGDVHTLENTVSEFTESSNIATINILSRDRNALTVTVKSSVSRLYVYSETLFPVFANIIIENRSSALTLILDNMRLLSPSVDNPTIVMNSAVNLNLVMYRGCEVYGATGAMGERASSAGSRGGTGGKGGIAIQCHTLIICSSARIYGGTGGKGGTGERGGNIGGFGGIGGEGNLAIKAVCVIIRSNNVYIVGGKGGKGGTGGVSNSGVGVKGGAGGRGSEALADTVTVTDAENYVNVSVQKGENGANGDKGTLGPIIGYD